jgi:O-antigen/teichoic acid export membrane protein
MTSPTRRFPRPALNVVSNWGAFLFYSVGAFFVSPFVVRSLGHDVYGTWALLGSTLGYLGLLDLGVRGAVTRFVSRLHASGDHGEATRFASAAMVVFLASALLAVLLGGLIALILPVFEIPAELLPDARVTVMVISFTIGLTLVTGVYGGIVIAMQRFDLSNAAAITVEAARLVAVVLVLRAGHGLLALAVIQLGAAVLNLGINVALSRRTYPELRPKLSGWERAHLREMIRFSLTTTVMNWSTIIVLQLDAIVIGAFLPVAMVTYFVVASGLTDYARKTIGAISRPITPLVSALEGSGQMDDARNVPLVSARVASLALFPIAATFLTRGPTFLELWMGPEFTGPSGEVLFVLSIALWLDGARQVFASSLIGLGRHAALTRPYALEAVLNVGLSVYLVGRLGIYGVALGTTLPRVLVSAAILPRIFSRVLEVPIGRLWMDAWIRPTFAILPFLAASWAMDKTGTPSGLLIFFAEVAVLLPIAAVGAWFVGLRKPERAAVRRRIRGMFGAGAV